MECSKISPALSLLMKHLVIGQRQKAPNFLAFFGHYTVVCFVATMVVHSQKRTETSLITEADPITESDKAVRAVHSCNSWFSSKVIQYFCRHGPCIQESYLVVGEVGKLGQVKHSI